MPAAVPTVQLTLPGKPWWRSRTLWMNLIVLLAAAVELELQLLQPLLPVNVYAVLAFALPVLNVALRTITAHPLTASPAQPAPAAEQQP